MQRLHEWVVMNNTNTTTSNNSSTGYKNRFKKLVSYAQAHTAPTVTKTEVELLNSNALHYKEYYEMNSYKWTSSIIINTSLFNDKWTVKFFIDDDFRGKRTGEGYDKLIAALGFYLNTPHYGTPEYNDLLIESAESIEADFKEYENLWD